MDAKFLELYIHIPFCERKCAYCDFLSFVEKDNLSIKLYIEKLISEIRSKKSLANDYLVTSIYIGGGTPTSINEEYIYEIMRAIAENYQVSEHVEVSIEANPHSITLDKMRKYKNAGINRISIGVQSVNNDELKTLGRLHTYEEFLKAYDDVIHAGFSNINFDIINGIPGETQESYRNTLKNLIKLMPKHLSIYNLIVEPNTPFYKMKEEGKLNLPTEEEMEKIDDVTKEMTTHFHYERYEISNYSKKGFECLHNLGYWSDISYLGFGLGAASYFEGFRYKNFSTMPKYMNIYYDNFESTINKYIFYEETNLILRKDSISEYIYLGMRKTSGISEKEFYDKYKEKIEDIYGATLKKYIDMGLMIHAGDRYFLTEKGLDLSNQIFADFVL